MTPASQASPRARRGEIFSPVSSTPACSAAEEDVEIDEHDHGGANSTGVGELVGRVSLDELAERLPHGLLARRRPVGDRAGALDRGHVLGGSRASEHLPQRRAVEGRDREGPAGLALPVVEHGEPACLRRGGLLLLEDGSFVGVGLLGCDDLEQMLLEAVEALRVVVPGLAEQVTLSPGHLLGGECVGELVDPPDHHPRLVGPDVAGRQRVPGERVRLEVVPEPHGTVRRRAGLLRLMGEPVDGRGCADVLAKVDVVRVRRHPRLELSTCATSLVTSTSVSAVSAASIDHTEACATASAISRICDTRWRGVVIAVMVRPSTRHRHRSAQNPCIHRVLANSKVKPRLAWLMCSGATQEVAHHVDPPETFGRVN
jgi:hypothetical protein